MIRAAVFYLFDKECGALCIMAVSTNLMIRFSEISIFTIMMHGRILCFLADCLFQAFRCKSSRTQNLKMFKRPLESLFSRVFHCYYYEDVYLVTSVIEYLCG